MYSLEQHIAMIFIIVGSIGLLFAMAGLIKTILPTKAELRRRDFNRKYIKGKR